MCMLAFHVRALALEPAADLAYMIEQLQAVGVADTEGC